MKKADIENFKREILDAWIEEIYTENEETLKLRGLTGDNRESLALGLQYNVFNSLLRTLLRLREREE